MHDPIFETARLARDPRFDGSFFVGVKTTGVYCRPVCPVRQPRSANITIFPTAAAAAAAGYRPCLRCRPETAPGTPAWSGTSTTVSRALQMISDGALDEFGQESLCERLGVSPRHLSRLFIKHVGASPKSVAQTRRLHFASKLLNESTLSMADIAFSSGYGSVRRFNDHIKQTWGRVPSQLRALAQVSSGSPAALQIKLCYRPPYDYEALLAFLAVRATPGIESVHNGQYSRTFMVDGHPGSLTVRHHPDDRQLICHIDAANPRSLMRIVSRVKRMFDLDASPIEINDTLGRDPLLAPLINMHPGQRVPGGWDPFEIAVRAIVGQQISVKAATTIMGRIVEKHGVTAHGRLFFPQAEAIADLDPASLPMPTRRALAIRTLARAVLEGKVNFDAAHSRESVIDQLVSLKGIGIWTAQYIALRATNDPDAFLHSDLVIKRAAQAHLNICTEKQLLAHADCWRPWRAYAGMHLWRAATHGS